MVDQKILNYGTYFGAAILLAIGAFAPQIQALVADNPYLTVIVGILLLSISQVGSDLAAKKQVAAAKIQQAQEEMA